MLPIRTVVCPLDFSEPSNKALQVAIEMAVHFQAELVILHVISPVRPVLSDPGYIFVAPEGYEQQEKMTAEEQLRIATKQFPAELKLRTAIGTGDAADEIVRIAKTEAADLIVISTHGLTGWRHLVFGSVAEKVIRLADRPVLVIPAHDSEAEGD